MSGGLSGYVVKGKSELCEIAPGVFVGFDAGRITDFVQRSFMLMRKPHLPSLHQRTSAYSFCLCAS